MKLGVRGKLFVLSLLTILAVGLASGAYLGHELRRWMERRIERELLADAQSGRALVEDARGAATVEQVDPLADRLGQATGARITIVDHGGRVLGDSQFDATVLAAQSGLGGGPQAGPPDAPQGAPAGPASGGPARGARTLGVPIAGAPDMIAVSVPWVRPEGRGMIRAMLPHDQIDHTLDELRFLILVAGLLGLVTAVLMSAGASWFSARELRSLVRHAGAIARGASPRRLAVRSHDELAGLAGSFNRMADELERSVADLAQERDRFAAVLEGMEEAVLALDSSQRVTLANRAALALLGLADPPVGRALVEVTRAPAVHELVARAVGGSEAVGELELAGGKQLLVRAAPLRATGGSVLVLRDVTELRRLEAVRRDFVANVSHELRTPVSVILANAETLLAGGLSDPARAREFLEGLGRNAERLARLVADLLDISRLEAGRHPLELQPLAVAPALRRSLEAVQVPAIAKRLHFQVECDEEIAVLGDAKAVDQVLLNLADNAVKYTPDGGHVLLRALPAAGATRIEVRDDGPGIAPEHRERIFERFYRVDPGRSRALGGTGLGLAIVKHLVTAMGGSVGVEPAQPRGSVFWLTLPRIGARAGAAASAAVPLAQRERPGAA